MTTTLTFWEAALWFAGGIAAVVLPTCVLMVLSVRRERKKPRLGPVDPVEVRRISAQLDSLSLAVARLADPAAPAAQPENVRSTA